MKLSEIIKIPEYYDRYMNKCDDVDIITAIETSIKELEEVPVKAWEAVGSKTYAEGKWTIKEILQHLIDTERIFSFRALSFARGEKQPLPFFSENEYAANSNADARELKDILDELMYLHRSLLSMYRSFTAEMLLKTGPGFAEGFTVAAIGFILPGHQRWHFDVIKERYSGL